MKWLYLLNLVFIILMIFIEKKRPQALIAWILVISFLPGVGIILFLFLGRTFLVAKSRHLFEKTLFSKAYSEFIEEQFKQTMHKRNQMIDEDIAKWAELMLLNLQGGRSIYTGDNKITLFTEAKHKYDTLFEDIKNAKSTIHIQYFIFQSDEIGQKFVKLLVEKAREGVEVRLLYDNFGSVKTSKRLFKSLAQAGGQVNRYYGRYFWSFFNFNHRNHRKIVVIDGKLSYVGGMNIGREYMLGRGKILRWRDSHIKIEGSATLMLQERFLMDWIFSSKNEKINIEDKGQLLKFFPPNQSTGSTGIQIVSSGPDVKEEAIKNAYNKMITDANETVFIQTPYLVLDEATLTSIKIAAMSGVDIKIMIPGIPDKPSVYAITLAFAGELMDAGVKIYAYPGFLHAKTIVADGLIASIGTTNFDERSFSLNFEVNAFIYDHVEACLFQEVFLKDLEISRELTKDDLKKLPVLYRFFSRFLYLLSPLA